VILIRIFALEASIVICMKILMVCLGNICRSPMAEGVMLSLIQEQEMDWEVDSAGTGSWHIGELPDRRAIATCKRHGIDITSQRARQIRSDDIDAFDLILTMDRANHIDVLQLARSEAHQRKIKLIMQYGASEETDVPDPYYDGSFDQVYTLLQTACAEVMRSLK
jgi:protein-tyrosine phosphatase